MVGGGKSERVGGGWRGVETKEESKGSMGIEPKIKLQQALALEEIAPPKAPPNL